MDREKEIIRLMVGKPWDDKGDNIEKGFNCYSFFKYVYHVFLGIHISDQGDNIKAGETIKIVKAFNTVIGRNEWVKVDTPKPFDAVALSMNRKIHHVGIWLNDTCVHAVKGQGVCTMTLNGLKRNGYSKVDFYRCLNLK